LKEKSGFPISPGAKRPKGFGAGVGGCPARCSEDVAMRTFDFSPYTRSTIGFESMFDRLNNLQSPENGNGYPSYDIVRTGEDAFRISLAVAGFSPNEINITAQQNLLIVTGQKPQNSQQDYLYKGISSGAFERRFDLADHVEVDAASFSNGLLQIDLVRRLPEAMKPRRIEIKNGSPSQSKGKQAA
jgi:molecular chaperone IbpA